MSLSMLLNIIVGCFILIGAVIAFILAYILGKTANRENDSLAYIFVDYGKQVSNPIKGRRTHTGSSGSKYQYRVKGNLKEVFLPVNYQIKYHKSRRMIFVDSDYSRIALPQYGDTGLSKDERSDLIFGLTSSHLISQAVQAFSGKISMGIVIIAIVVALVVGVGATYMVTRPKASQTQQTTTQQTQPTTTVLPPAHQ